MSILGFYIVDRYIHPNGSTCLFVRSNPFCRDWKGLAWARDNAAQSEILPRVRRFGA